MHHLILDVVIPQTKHSIKQTFHDEGVPWSLGRPI
jgi:hypothetical protein